MIPFNPISELAVEEATEVNINVDFNQKANAINFHITFVPPLFSPLSLPSFVMACAFPSPILQHR